MLAAGGRDEVATGNVVYGFEGNLGPTRNDGSDPLVELAIFLQPQSGDKWGEESGEAAAAAPSR
jgi:hypothetical protein